MITCKPKPTPTPVQNTDRYYIETISIPTSAPANGYNWNVNGQISTFNCYFWMFSTIDIKGINGAKINPAKGETSYGFSATFAELPSNAQGDIAAVSHYFTKDASNTKVKLAILCAIKPTHTVNLSNGVVTPIDTSKFFIKNVAISYNVSAKKQGC